MFAMKGFTPSDWEIMQKYLVPSKVTRGSVIYKNGQEALSMYFVEEGSVKLVVRKAVDGSEDETVSVIKPGGFFGEEGLLGEDALFQYTAVSNEDSKICVFSRDSLQKLMVSSMKTGTKLLLGITKTYREAIAVSEQTGKILVFYSPRGGAGKTSLAVNVAESLGRLNNRVAFLDADFQFGNSHLYAGVKSNPNISRCLQLETSLGYDRIKHYLQPAGLVHYLTVSDLPQDAEIVTRTHLNHILTELNRKYAYVVVDCKCAADEQTLLLWDIADRLFLIGQPDLTSLVSFRSLFSVFKRLNYPKDKLFCIINKFRDNDKAFIEEYKKIIPIDPFVIHEDAKNTTEALIKGSPCVTFAPDSLFAKDLRALMVHLVGDIQKPIEKGGIFNRLKSFFG